MAQQEVVPISFGGQLQDILTSIEIERQDNALIGKIRKGRKRQTLREIDYVSVAIWPF